MLLLAKLNLFIGAARREQAKKALVFYSTFLGDVEQATKGKKEVTDEVILSIGKSWRKAIESNVLIAKERGSESLLEQMNTELRLLGDLLPEQLSEVLLKQHIKHFIATEDGANLGRIMGLLKQHFTGLYDGKMASQITRELLNK